MTGLLPIGGSGLQNLGDPVCPYKGLGAYTEADKDYFFARDTARDLVVANLMASRLTVLYGPSGVGKSSQLQAGVLPLLRQTAEGAFSYLAVEEAIIVYWASWRNDPRVELGNPLLHAVPRPEVVRDLAARRPPLSLELVQEVATRFHADVYLLLDQFEELALYHTNDLGKAFDAELGRIVAAPGVPVSVLLGVRKMPSPSLTGSSRTSRGSSTTTCDWITRPRQRRGRPSSSRSCATTAFRPSSGRWRSNRSL